MEAKHSTVVDNFKGLVRSSKDFVKSTIKKSLNNNGQDLTRAPVDMFSRLQREAFSELMKLKDIQEKLENMLMYQNFSAPLPFQRAKTYVKAAFSVVGSLLLLEDDFVASSERLENSGTKTGVNSRLTFETVIRNKDSLVAEFNSRAGYESLGLYHLKYHASINDLFSLVLVPLGAQCCNFTMSPSSRLCHNDELQASGSPIFHEVHNFAAGVTLRGLNFGASVAQLVAGPSMETATFNRNDCHLTTFGQLTYKPLVNLEIFLSSLWQVRRPSSDLVKISSLTMPLIHLKRSRDSDADVPIQKVENSDVGTGAPHSVALIVGGEYLESTKFEGWVEFDVPLNENSIKYGVSFCDMPANELGWGLRASGALLGVEQFQMEGFLNFDLSRGNAKFQPGLIYVKEGRSRVAALMLRSSWSV